MLGADSYETDSEVAYILGKGNVPVGIGENTKIKYRNLPKSKSSHAVLILCFLTSNISTFILCRECIIDKNARIGKNVIIANSEVGFCN